MPIAGSRLAGEHEYAFKHALIRDVAYSTLPKAVRARKHAEVGDVHQRARRRPLRGRDRDRRRALRPRRGARRRAPTSRPSELDAIAARALEALEAAGDLAAGLYSNSEAFAHYEAALGLERLEARARARIAEKLGDVALRLGRVDRAVEVWEQCMEYHRGEEDLVRIGDLHRKIGAALWNKGDREASIEHYQRGIDLLKDGPPSHRARPPLRGGRVALHAHRRQHARDLRLGEGPAPRRAPRGGGRGEPRPRDLRPRLRPHRRRGARAGEPRALGRAGARDRPGERRSARCSRSATTSRSPRPTTRARRPRTARASRSASRSVTSPPRSSCTRRSPASRSTRATGRRSRRRPTRPRELAEREGLAGKLCFPYSLRGILRWHDGEHDGGGRGPRARPRARRPGRALRGRLPGALLARRRPPRLAATTPTPTRRSPARSTSASAPGCRPIARGDRGARRQPGALGQATSGPPRSPPTPRGWPSGSATRSARPRASRPAGAAADEPAERDAAARRGSRALAGAAPPDRRRALRVAAGARVGRAPTPAPRPRTPSGSRRTGACGPARREGRRSPCPGSPDRRRR